MTTWATIVNRHVRRGEDQAYAAHCADEWERRQTPTVHLRDAYHDYDYHTACGLAVPLEQLTMMENRVTCRRCLRSTQLREQPRRCPGCGTPAISRHAYVCESCARECTSQYCGVRPVRRYVCNNGD